MDVMHGVLCVQFQLKSWLGFQYLRTLVQVGVEVWAVLGFSMVVDGYVLMRTLKGIAASRPEGVSLLNHVKKVGFSSRSKHKRLFSAGCQ